MKFSECQETFYQPCGQNSSTPYQEVLNLMVNELVKQQNYVAGFNIGLPEDTSAEERALRLENCINFQIQSLEYEMFSVTEWNLRLGAGSDILNFLLELVPGAPDVTARP